MLYKTFQGEQISRLGFGLMRLPLTDGDQSHINYEKVEEMFLYACENGINYFDTAYPYHNGYSERVLGKILENTHLRSKVNIATKLFTLVMDEPWFDPGKMLEEQLQRLKTDHIDFYLMHGLNEKLWKTLRDKFQIRTWLDELKRTGVVRYAGFSFHDSLPVFKSILDDYQWDFAQIQYNYMDVQLQAGDEGIAYAREKGVPLDIMEPLKGGSLIFPNYPAIDEIKARYGLSELSNAKLGLRFVLSQEGLLSVLSGMSNLDQMMENIEIAGCSPEGCCTDTEKACIAEIRSFLSGIEGIGCTGCRYCCAGCPQELQIPEAFHMYNEGKRFNNPEAQLRVFNRSCANLSDCIACGQCVEACPQHLDIPTLLKEVRTYFVGQ